MEKVTFPLIGLTGTNPLHVLAAYGTLFISEALPARYRARLSWRDTGEGHPVLEIAAEGCPTPTARTWCESVTEHVRTNIGTLGLVALGDKPGAEVATFREVAELWIASGVDAATYVRLLSGVASDIVVHAKKDAKKQEVSPTPFSFSNGASGQLLLKDFRTMATGESWTANHLYKALFDPPPPLSKDTSLNWDPADNRESAYLPERAEAWTKRHPSTNVPANVLAFLGLGLLTIFPRRNGISALGWFSDGRQRGFLWPLWHPALNTAEVRALLALRADRLPAQERQARGIFAIYRADVVNPSGKRIFFGRATPIVLDYAVPASVQYS